jgi:hypothetical protein
MLPVKESIFWSDGCGGQNKNLFIVCLWSHVVQRGFAEKVRHRFLISGHKFLPSDRDFAQIEKRNRTKINEVHVPSDWFDVVQTSRTSNPLHVIAVTHQDIYDLNDFSANHYARPPAASKFRIRDIIEYCVSQDNPSL